MTRHCAVLACNDVECSRGVACSVNYADTAAFCIELATRNNTAVHGVHLVAHLSKFVSRLVDVCSQYWGKFVVYFCCQLCHICAGVKIPGLTSLNVN